MCEELVEGHQVQEQGPGALEQRGAWGLGARSYSPWGRMGLDTTEATEHRSIYKGLNKKLVQ